MGNIRTLICSSFEELVSDTHYDKVSVTAICQRCSISRSTFYTHFKDKRAIVEAILRQDVIASLYGMKDLCTVADPDNLGDMSFKLLYRYFYSKRRFYRNLIGLFDSQDDLFVRVVMQELTSLNLTLMECFPNRCEEWEKDYVALYYSSSQAKILQKWILDGMHVPADDLARLYKRLWSMPWAYVIGSKGDPRAAGASSD